MTPIEALRAENRALQQAVLDLLARVQKLEAEAEQRRFAAFAATAPRAA